MKITRIFLLIFFGICLQLLSFGQNCNYLIAHEIIEKRGEVYAKININPNQDFELLSKISVDKIAYNHIFAYLNHSSLKLIQAANYEIEVLKSAGELFKQQKNSKSFSFTQYPSYYQYDSLMHAFEQNYPDLCKLHSIGTLNSGKEIFVLEITDSINSVNNKPQFLFTSSMHGDELVGYVLMLRLIDYLLTNNNQDSLVTHLLKTVNIFINPLANPNGAYYNSNQSVSGAIRFNLNGIDLNRNFPDPDDGLHPDGNAWQEETIIFMDFADSMDFVLASNIHGGAEVFNYPWDTWSKRTADDAWWQSIGRAYVDTIHKYSPQNYFIGFNNGITNGYDWYHVSGGRQDYMNFFHKCREFTLEISDVKLAAESRLDDFWEYNYRSFLNYINVLNFGLNGVITDSANNKPVNAKVRMLNYDKDSSFVYADSKNGIYRRMLPTGFYKVEFSHDDYYTKIIDSVYVKIDSLTILDVSLSEKPSNLNNIQNSNIKVYPNPFGESLVVEMGVKSDYQISIFDINSRLIHRSVIANQSKFTFRTEKLLSGFYILQIKSGNKQIASKKLIKI